MTQNIQRDLHAAALPIGQRLRRYGQTLFRHSAGDLATGRRVNSRAEVQ